MRWGTTIVFPPTEIVTVGPVPLMLSVYALTSELLVELTELKCEVGDSALARNRSESSSSSGTGGDPEEHAISLTAIENFESCGPTCSRSWL